MYTSNLAVLGAFLLAGVMGAERCIPIKDEQGLYTADPKKDPDAKFIPGIELGELEFLDLNDLAVEWTRLESLRTARTVREVYIVNGLVPGNITRALNGENTGTRIYKVCCKAAQYHAFAGGFSQ